MTDAHRPAETSGNSFRRQGKPCGARRCRLRNRRGATLVEFAIVAPVLFLLILGMAEFGRMVMVQQILTNASREGARRAILEHAAASEVETFVGDYLTNTSVSGATVTVAPGTLTKIGFGDPVTITVAVPYAQVSWVPAPRFLGEVNLSGRSVMRAERPE